MKFRLHISQNSFFFSRMRARNIVGAFALILLTATVWSAPLTFSQASSDLQNTDKSRRYVAIDALQKFRSQGVAALLTNALTSESDLHVQAAILNSLTSLHDPASIPAIVPLLNSNSTFIRQRAAYAIGLIGGATAEKALATDFPRERDAYVRSTELMGLSLCGSANSVSTIQQGLSDSQAQVRAQAIEALRRIPGNASLNALQSDAEKDPILHQHIQQAIHERTNGAQ